MDNGQKVLVIVGPTASGKSGLAVRLAKRFDGEIVSADSRQVYRGLDIGTGKIGKREMQGVPHYLLDVASPKKAFTVHDFVIRAEQAMQNISRRGKLPIVVGGTGFYIDALLGRISLPNVAPDEKFRASARKKTAAQLYALLKKRDPKRAKAMNTPSERNNKIRLIRALEIARSRAKGSLSPKGSPSYDALWIGISPPQTVLERKIRSRLRSRIEMGMVAEGKRLHARGLSYKRMEELGLEYRALANLLQRKVSRKEFEESLFRDIRRYARKQVVYWRRNRNIIQSSSSTSHAIEHAVHAWLAQGAAS